MSDCPKCGYPLVWSIDQRRPWCSVFGDHRAPYAGLVELCMATPVVLTEYERSVRHRAVRGGLDRSAA